MSKVNTKQCKEFLVGCVRQDPKIVTGTWGGDDTGVAAFNAALQAKNWLREFKCKADPNGIYAADGGYETYSGSIIPFDQIKALRGFVLLPEQFDTAVRFVVIERIDGKLILGEDFGD